MKAALSFDEPRRAGDPPVAENKTTSTAASPSDYIVQIENPGRRADAERLLELHARVTGEPPVMWGPSIIGFGSYHYRYESGREGDACAAGFAPRRNEQVVYLSGAFPEQDQLLKQLGKHRMGKACLYIKRLDDVDLGVLERLIALSVAAIRRTYPATKGKTE